MSRLSGRDGRSRATAALVLTTALWGCSFTWAKAGGAGVNEAAGLPAGSLLGPLFLLAWRFGLAGVLWLLLFPSARRGWGLRSVKNAVMLGLLLWIPSALQVLGLDRTTEAVSAFLTSLSVIFVPLAMVVFLRRPPHPVMWIAVGLATAGIWLMTGAAPTGFGAGELLGLLCGLLFSAFIIAISEIMPRESVWRMTAGQFLVAGVAGGIGCAVIAGRPDALVPTAAWRLAAHVAVWPNLLLLIALPTMIAYAFMFRFQHRLTPTRAALVYLAEPIFAALFAFVAAGRGLSTIAFVGAILIVLANGVAEAAGRLDGSRGRPA